MFEQGWETVTGGGSPVDLSMLDDAALLDGYEQLLAAEARLRAEQARWLAAVHARQATVPVTGRATRSWLREEMRLTTTETNRRLALAWLPDTLPATAAALAGGEISAEHALTIATGCRYTPDRLLDALERTLLELARTATPGEVARAVDEVRARVGADENAAAAYTRRYATRGLQLDTTFGGFGSLTGTLSPDVAA